MKTETTLDLIDTPKGVKFRQVLEVVTQYIAEHPEERHEPDIELIRRAVKDAWPKEHARGVINK